VAPPKGLEPLTDWLTASRSTWLSYGGIICCAYHFSPKKTIYSFSIPRPPLTLGPAI
jgi:hypothetical protein